jgi:DNA-binding response OmpR family regulator
MFDRTSTNTNVNSLIAGEDPTTDRASDARRWIEIYARLIEFKEELLQRLAAGPAGNGQGGLQAPLDEKVAAAEMAHLKSRLAFWQARHASLAPVDLDEHLGIITATGEVIQLTRRENQLLRFLLNQPGRYFDARTLAARAWQDPRLASEQVRTYVVRLRRRLAQAEVACDLRSERRRGYALIFTEEGLRKTG